MRALALIALSLGCISKGTEIPPVHAGAGVTVDAKTQTVSIDPAVVPVLPSCAEGEVVVRGADAGWDCTSAIANADMVDGMHASSFMAAGAVAADSSKLGGVPAANYARSTAGDGVADDAKTLGGALPAAFATASAGDGVADSAKRVLVTSGVTCLPLVHYCPGPVSVGGVYCGSTDPTTGSFTFAYMTLRGQLNVTGYLAGKALCEKATGCGEAAHPCNTDELVRSAELGVSLPGSAWYSGGPGSANDCMGWTNGTSTYSGSNWGGYPGVWMSCASSVPIACCL
ncbi:MAG TPA: hypothetical protein VLW85_05290 [Myxococcales bacterium]|nr:hypothetical protein [Myxococcales bacterium]